MDGMYPLMGLALAREIQHDHLVAGGTATRSTPRAHATVRQGRPASQDWRPAPVLQVGRARATAPSAPMGCTA